MGRNTGDREMKLKETNHSYYCENYGCLEYGAWADFKSVWLDDDYNHCFRFDILEMLDSEEEPTGKFELCLFFILQRKGIYRPVVIKEIAEEDMPQIEQFLKDRKKYILKQWADIEGT